MIEKYGTVAFFNHPGGGVIHQDNGPDVVFHLSNVVPTKHHDKTLRARDYVLVKETTTTDGRAPRATMVKRTGCQNITGAKMTLTNEVPRD